MKPWLKWTISILIAALLAMGIFRMLWERRAQQQALAQQTTQHTVVEIHAGDLVLATTRKLSQGLEISGTLKALHTAVVKARVAGELQVLTLREGDRVQAGQIIAQVDPSEYRSRVRQAQQQADSTKTQIDISLRQYRNNQALVEQGFISATALETSSSNLAAAQANHLAALAALDVAQKSLDDTVLRAPISGQISQRLVQSGERVAIEARIVEIVDPSRLELEAMLSANDSLDLRIGQSAELQIEGSSQAIQARVARINPSAQAGNRAVLAYLSIEQPTGLRQGLFARGILATSQRSGLSVPLTAVRTDKPAPYVQRIENSLVVHQTVKLSVRGQIDGETFVIIQGIPENSPVISGLLGSLRVGTRVSITPTPAK